MCVCVCVGALVRWCAAVLVYVCAVCVGALVRWCMCVLCVLVRWCADVLVYVCGARALTHGAVEVQHHQQPPFALLEHSALGMRVCM